MTGQCHQLQTFKVFRFILFLLSVLALTAPGAYYIVSVSSRQHISLDYHHHKSILLHHHHIVVENNLTKPNNKNIIWDSFLPDVVPANYRFKNETKPEYQNYTIDLKELPETPVANYLLKIHNVTCFRPGVNVNATKNAQDGRCKCQHQFRGSHCGVPGSVWKPHPTLQHGPRPMFVLRYRPRRIVMGIVMNHELRMLEVRIRQLHSVVDVFVILESNITSGGDEKPLYVFDALQRGFLAEYQHKILYIYLNYIPKNYIRDGWQAEEYLRYKLSSESVSRVENELEDDLFLSFDADEIPKEDVLRFLKIYDGFWDPVMFNMRWSVYAYYWGHVEEGKVMNQIVGGSTFGYLRNTCKNNVYNLRSVRCFGTPTFEIGIAGDYAGHHCSWCFPPEGIAVKLRSAQRADLPRWGDYPEKLDLSYITNLVQRGKWFDGSAPLSLVTPQDDPDFAPDYVLKHAKLFQFLLFPPSSVVQEHQQ